jgi:hypothetical protein
VLSQVSRVDETPFSLHWPSGSLGISGRYVVMQYSNKLLILTGYHQLNIIAIWQGMVMPQSHSDLHFFWAHLEVYSWNVSFNVRMDMLKQLPNCWSFSKLSSQFSDWYIFLVSQDLEWTLSITVYCIFCQRHRCMYFVSSHSLQSSHRYINSIVHINCQWLRWAICLTMAFPPPSAFRIDRFHVVPPHRCQSAWLSFFGILHFTNHQEIQMPLQVFDWTERSEQWAILRKIPQRHVLAVCISRTY